MNTEMLGRPNGAAVPRREDRRGGWRLAPWILVAILLAAPAAAQVTHGPPRIRNVYIPADQLDLLFDNSSNGVLMPREKIRALWQEAQRRDPTQEVPPADAVLGQATYEARLADHELRIVGRIQIAKLRNDWQTVDLPFGGLAIESAQVGSQAARFGRRDDGTLFVVLDKEGRFELQLEISAPLASKGGDLATTLKLPPVPASEVLVKLGEGKRLQLGETMLQAASVENGEQTFRIAVDQTGLVPLVVSDRLAGGNRAPLVLVHSRSTGHIEPAGLRWEAIVDLDVCARAKDAFELRLPDAVDVAEIESPQLGQWTIRDLGDGTSTVSLAFRKPVLGRRSVRLLGLAPVPADAEWNIPTVKVLEAASHVGQVSIVASPSLRVEVGALAGIGPERVSAAVGPPDGAAPDAPAPKDRAPLAFRFWDEDFRLPLRVLPRQRAVQASVATLVEASRSGLALRSSVTVQPRHAPVFDVRVALPRDWEVTSVLAAGEPVEWEPVAEAGVDPAAEAARQTVRFDLARPLGPGQSLQVALAAQRHPAGWLEQDEGFSELPMPEVRLAGAEEVEGTLLVQAPPDLELLLADLSNEMEPVAADGSGSASAETAGTSLQYSYRDGARVAGRIQVRSRPAKVSAQTLAFVRLDRGKLDVHYQLDLHIRQGKVRQIRFTLPAAAGEKLQIVPVDSEARVIEQRHTRLPAADGLAPQNLWQIVLDRPVTDDLTLALDFGQTFSAQAGARSVSAKAAAPVEIPVLAMQDVSRQSGTVAVEAAGDQQIDHRPENLRELDPADVFKPRAYVPTQRIVAAYQYQRLPYRLTISATRHPSESVLTAICQSVEIVSIAGREGRTRHRARFWLKNLNVQHLPVTLPEKADLWSVMLDSEPVEVRRQEGVCMVPLPAGATGSGGDAREVTLLYETESPRLAGDGFWGRLWPQTVRQRAPEIGITTLDATWHVRPPEGTDLVSAGGDFAPEDRLTRPTLAAGLAETIADQSTRGLGWKLGGVVGAAILVGIFALLSSVKRGFSVLEFLVLITIIMVLIALLLPSVQSSRESARRAACSNNLKQIGLALHNYHAAHGQFPPAAIGPADVPRERQFSWFVAILPYLEQQALYNSLRLDLPCDHPDNAALLQVSLMNWICPSSPYQTEEELSKTAYVAITGADSTLGPGRVDGVIGTDKGLAIGDIVDGTSNTIVVAEVTDGGPWFAAGPGTARRIDDWIEKKSWSHHVGGGLFLFADGSARFVSSNIDPQTLRHLATARGLDPLPNEDLADESPAEGEAPPASPAPESAATPLLAEAPPPAETPASGEKDAKDEGEPKVEAPAPPPAPETKPADEAPEPPQVSRGERGRLSLRLTLETPKGEAIRFRREGGLGELVLGLQDQRAALAIQWFLVAAGVLAAWIGRRASGSRRAIAVVAGLAVPIGLSGLVPLAWTPLLDGLLLGALAAAGLWIVLRIAAEIRASVPGPTTTASAIALAMLVGAKAVAADDAPAAGAAPAPVQQARVPNLTLFIPYDPAKDKPLDCTQVYLPHDEFQRLWKRAHPDEPNRAAPDVRAMVSHAEYAGRLENDVARFDGRLVVHHLDDAWARIALPLGDVALEKIEINGRPATLVDGDPAGEPPAIVLEQPGMHVVDVRFSVPVSRLGATGQMTVPLGAVPSGRLWFRLPADDLDVQVSGSPGGWRRQADAQSAGESLSVPLGAAGELSVRWQPRRVEARAGQLVSVDQALLVEALDSGLHFHARLHYRIQQGSLGELQLRLPADVAVEGVHGAEVADWSIETDPAAGPDPPGRRLVIALKTELTTGTDVDVQGFRRNRTWTGPVAVEALEPLGAARETGRVAIAGSDRLQVRVDQADRLDQIDRASMELPHEPADGSALLSAYRYTSRPWQLRLQVERHQPRVEISDRTTVTVTSRQATLRSLLTADVTGAPVPSLELRLPAALRVAQVRVPPGADWFVDRDEQGQRLKAELGEAAMGKLELAVSGTLARDSSQAEFVVPGVVAEGVQAQRGQLAIHLDDDLEAVLADDGATRPIDPGALDAVLRPDGVRAAHYAFQYDAPPKALRLRLSAAPSRFSADVTTVVSVREGAVAYVGKVDFEIRQAGRSRFQLVAPEWLGDDVRIEGEQIRQIRSQATGGSRTWEIELQQPVRGSWRLHLLQTLPLSDDGTVPAPVIRPLDAERSRSHVVLENATADEIATASVRGATAVPIAEVPAPLTDNLRRQAVAAYRIHDGDASLAWQRRVREQETGLAATISLADLITVVHADGGYRARASYTIRNFTLQFLALELPAESRVWSVHVSGQPVRPAKIRRQARSITLLPLEKTSAGDFSSDVEVIYSGRLEEPLGRWTRVRPPAPKIVSDVPVSRTLWTLVVPRPYRVGLVEGESNLEEVAAAFQQEERKLSYLDELRQIMSVASSKSGSAARSKALYNLKQAGAKLQGYARQDAETGAENAADVQQRAQQIEAEVQRLEDSTTDARRVEDDADLYFAVPGRALEGVEFGVDVEQSLEKLLESKTTDEEAVEEDETKRLDRLGGRPEQRRGDLRKQAAEQLAKLQSMRQEESLPQEAAEPGPSARQEAETAGMAGMPAPVERHAGEVVSQDERGARAEAAKAGYLSLEVDLAPVGTAYHFRKLHGDPRLVLDARHESLDRSLSAMIWAGLCLAVAAVAVYGLRRPDAIALARRHWPWLAAATGTIWLFLLPAGAVGLLLLAISLCVLVSRSRTKGA